MIILLLIYGAKKLSTRNNGKTNTGDNISNSSSSGVSSSSITSSSDTSDSGATIVMSKKPGNYSFLFWIFLAFISAPSYTYLSTSQSRFTSFSSSSPWSVACYWSILYTKNVLVIERKSERCFWWVSERKGLFSKHNCIFKILLIFDFMEWQYY